MKNLKKILLLLLIISLILTGCQGTPSEAEEPGDTPEPEASQGSESAYDAMVLSQDETSVTVLDARGNTLVIDKNPERVIDLSGQGEPTTASYSGSDQIRATLPPWSGSR